MINSKINLNCFSILQMNIQGLNNVSKFDDLKFFLTPFKENIDIIVIGETKLKSSFPHNLYNLSGYNKHVCCRNSKNSGGGLIIFIRKSIKVLKIEKFTDLFEKILITMKINNTCFSLIGYYRPPDPKSIIPFMSDIELEISTKTNRTIIIGDINIDSNGDNKESRNYINLLKSYNMVVSNTVQTRNMSNKTIDHFITNFSNECTIENHTIHNNLSDHNFVLSTVNDTKSKRQKVVKEFIHKDYNAMMKDWNNDPVKEEILAMNDPDDITNSLISLTNKIIKAHTSVTRIKLSNKYKDCPWYNLKVIKALRKKRSLAKRLKRDKKNRISLKRHLLMQSRKVKKIIESEKRKYMYEHLVTKSRKRTWKNLNSLLGRKVNQQINGIIDNDILLTDDISIAQKLNQHFIQSVNELANKACPGQAPLEISSQVNSIGFDQIDDDEVSCTIKLLRNSAPGIDNISVKDLKLFNTEVSPIIRHLYNKVIETGRYPNAFKKAIVVPLNKSGDTTNAGDYRPISILTAYNKIIEKILYKKLSEFLTKYKILSDNQFGFRPKSNTECAVIEMTETIKKAIDAKKVISATFLDLKKAFDLVHHKTLIQVLHLSGIRGSMLDVIESYLTSRTQVVKVNDKFSESIKIEHGVIQGSILSSLLFNIFINSVASLKGIHGRIIMYADDIVLLIEHHPKESMEEKIKHDVKLLKKYITNLGMIINADKTHYMFFYSPFSSPQFQDEIHIDDELNISRVDKIKYLGLMLDPNLKMNEHGKLVESKLCAASGMLWKLKNVLPLQTKKDIYYTLFHTHLCYLITVWGSACDNVIKPIQCIQNRTLRNVFGLDRRTPKVVMYAHKVERILPIRALHYLNTAAFMYDVVNKNIHSSIVVDKNNCKGRRANKLKSSAHKTNIGKKRITCIGSHIYNKIPDDIKHLRYNKAFKWALSCHIRTEHFLQDCFDVKYLQKYGEST